MSAQDLSNPNDQQTAAAVVVVDGSRLVRGMIRKIVNKALPDARVADFATAREALAHLAEHGADLVTTALVLPDMDGFEFCRSVREETALRYIPLIAVSGDVTSRLHDQGMSDEITDYFDKSQGLDALGTFIEGYVNPDRSKLTGQVLFVEDSKVVAVATQRLLRHAGLEVTHSVNVEDAIVTLQAGGDSGLPGPHVVLTDVTLRGDLSGEDLLRVIRQDLEWDRGTLPVVIMTGDDDQENQARLLRAGANDLVVKPVDGGLLVNKLRFQLHLAQRHRQKILKNSI